MRTEQEIMERIEKFTQYRNWAESTQTFDEHRREVVVEAHQAEINALRWVLSGEVK